MLATCLYFPMRTQTKRTSGSFGLGKTSHLLFSVSCRYILLYTATVIARLQSSSKSFHEKIEEYNFLKNKKMTIFEALNHFMPALKELCVLCNVCMKGNDVTSVQGFRFCSGGLERSCAEFDSYFSCL